MKIISKLDMDSVLKLVEEGKISNTCVIPINEVLKKIVRKYLDDNTGFDTFPVLAVTRVQGKEGIKESWNDLDSLVPIMEGDVLIEFDMPDDMIATISYQEFLSMNNKTDFFPDEINNSLKLEKHSADENEFAFLPYLIFNYCTGFKQVGPDWESENCELSPVEDLNKICHFNNVGGKE